MTTDRFSDSHSPQAEDAPLLPDASFWIEGCFVQPVLHRMVRGGEAVQVEPKVIQVLAVLAAHAGDPVTREYLMDTVWAGTIVTDDVLTRCVSEIRKLFDDTPRRPRVVETLPRVGYRLLVPVTYGGDSAPSRAPAFDVAVTASSPRRKRRVGLRAAGAAGVLLLAAGLAWGGLRQAPSEGPTRPVHAVPLTSLPGIEYAPALSPTGDRIAFVWRPDPAAAADLYVMPVDAAQPLRLTDDPAGERSPAWAPDGRRLAFLRSSDADCGVFVIPALGGPERRLASCTPHSFGDLTWSSDGRALVLSDAPAPAAPNVLYRVDAETGDRERLDYPTDASVGDYQPRFSPDGRTLLFLRSLGEGQVDLFLLTPADGTLRRLTHDEAGIAGQTWTPDGRHVVFSSNRTGTLSLWRIPAAGGEPAWLGVPDAALRPTMAGDRLVYERWDVDTNLRLVDRDGPSEAPVILCPSTWTDTDPRFSPDGKRVAFISNRSGERAVWTCDADGTDPVRLASHGPTQVFAPRWSPDGRRLAYTVFVDGQADVFVLDRPGEVPRRLTTAASNEVYPSWSSDGRWIYFGSDRTETMEVWKLPAGGGEPEQVTHGGGFIAFASPDGRWLYHTREGVSGLWRQALGPPGDAVRVLGDFDLSTAVQWTVQPDGLYAIDRSDPADVAVVRWDADTWTRERVRALGAVNVAGGFTMTPDSRRLVYVQVDRREADLMRIDDLR